MTPSGLRIAGSRDAGVWHIHVALVVVFTLPSRIPWPTTQPFPEASWPPCGLIAGVKSPQGKDTTLKLESTWTAYRSGSLDEGRKFFREIRQTQPTSLITPNTSATTANCCIVWLRRALNQIYPTTPSSSSDNSNGIANAFISDGGAITVNGKTWTTEEYIRRGTVSPSSSQTLRIRDFMLARPTTSDDDSTGEVAASYEVIRQPKDQNQQSRIFAHILVRIDKDPNANVQPGEEDDGRRIMTIDEERWEGTLYRSQPQPAHSGTGN